MSVNVDEVKPKPVAPRRSSLKNRQPLKFDPDKVLKKKRNSVSFGKTDTFEFKAMKAMFKEGEGEKKEETKEDKEKHQQFLKDRKASIKNEFSLIKDLMKKSTQAIIEEEENEDEAKKNMKKNVEMVKEDLKEEDSESSNSSKSNSGSDKESESKSSSPSKSSKTSSPSKSSKHSSRNESEDKKEKKKKKNKNEKHEKKSNKSLKESKLKNKKKAKDEEKDINKEKKEENAEKETEKISVKKNKKAGFVEKKEENEEKESENKKEKEKQKEEDNQKESEKKEEGKISIMTLKDVQDIELDKIAYIALTNGNIIIIKNQGEDLVQDLLNVPNQILRENKIKKSPMPQPLQQKCYSQKWIEIQRNQNKEPSDFLDNKYKTIEKNMNYNNNIDNKYKRKTYSITTGSSNNSESPNYSPNYNKPIIIPKSYFLNQENPKFQLYSSGAPEFENINEYQKFNYSNTPLSQSKTMSKTQRNKSQKILVSSKPMNFYQNQIPFQSEVIESPKVKYIYTNTRNIQTNYADPSKNQYQNQFQNSKFNRNNYVNSMEFKPQSSRQFNNNSIPTTPRQIYNSYNPNLSQANPQFAKPNYNQNIKTQVSQLNNSYQFQKSPNFPNRNIINYHSRFNSYIVDSFNDLDNLEEEDQFNQESEELGNSEKNKVKLKNPIYRSQKYIIIKKSM